MEAGKVPLLLLTTYYDGGGDRVERLDGTRNVDRGATREIAESCVCLAAAA